MEIEEIDLNLLKKRVLGSVGALIGRTIIVQFIGLAAFGVLTVYLEPSEIGIFIAVSALMRIFWLFSDFGLGASLIQKKGQLEPEELKMAFTLQLILAGVISAAGFLGRDWIFDLAGFGGQGKFLYFALLAAFFLSTFKTIPSILLEKTVRFHKLIIPQTVEQLVFHILVVFLAIAGFGINSYSWAVLVSSLAGVPLYYLVSPWRPGLAFDWPAARRLLSFGILFQGKTFLAAIKDDLLIFFVKAANLLSFTELGYIAWGQKWAFAPYRFTVDSVTKVAFPAFSKIQENRAVLREGIEKSLFFVSFFVLPILAGLVFGVFKIVEFFPKYAKWEPALISLCFFAGNAAISAWSGILVNVLDATGRVKTTLGLMAMWTSLIWILTIGLIYKFGYNGFALASFLVTLTIAATVYLLKQTIEFSFIKHVWKPAAAAAVMTGVLRVFEGLTVNVGRLMAVEFFGGIIYLTVMIVLDKHIRCILKIRSKYI